MICEACLKEIPIRDAIYCPFCGNNIGQIPPSGSRGWEYCEIRRTKEKLWLSEVIYFYADTVDNVWKYSAGESTRLKFFIMRTDYLENKLREIHAEFVNKLLNNNWVLLDKRGNEWWSLRFRRKTI